MIKTLMKFNLLIIITYLGIIVIILSVLPSSGHNLVSTTSEENPNFSTYATSNDHMNAQIDKLSFSKLLIDKANEVKNVEPFLNNQTRNAGNRYEEWKKSNRKLIKDTPRYYALLQFDKYNWKVDPQWGCLDRLWWHESNWNHKAGYPEGHRAYGIPQSYPGDKMKEAGKDWRTNPETQINWGLEYINKRYGTPCKAFQFWKQEAEYGDNGYGWY